MISMASHELQEHVVYTYYGVTYVPHYRIRGLYVGPGGLTYLEEFLRRHCKTAKMYLWPRVYPEDEK